MSLTIILIAITVLTSWYAWNNPAIQSKWIMNPPKIANGEYLRFLTSGFIHANWQHLIFNMFTFYFAGTNLENIFTQIFGETGKIYFVLLYLAAIVASDLPSYFSHKNDSNYNTLGDSGGVSAVLFSLVLFAPTSTILIYFIPMPFIVFAVLYVFYSLYMVRAGTDNVNHSAHLWGAAFGIVCCIILYPAAIEIFTNDLRNWKIFN